MSPSKSDKVRAALIDIRDNISAVQDFVEGGGRNGGPIFDKKTFYAVTRALEIISEASRKIPEDIKARHPQIDWRSIRDAGNFYRHSYDRVEAEFVRETVDHGLPALAKFVEIELAADNEI